MAHIKLALFQNMKFAKVDSGMMYYTIAYPYYLITSERVHFYLDENTSVDKQKVWKSEQQTPWFGSILGK